jgi:bacteriocin biosynthesis cyclodehydratase domain-containing protein
MKPRLRTNYYLLYEPPDRDGEEALTVLSERRRIELKGRFLREFTRYVVPLLDGSHELDEIREQVADVFAPGDLDAALELLVAQRLLEDVDDDPAAADEMRRTAPQANYVHELGADPKAVAQALARMRITLVGAGSLGAALAQGLVAAGVRNLHAVDARAVRPQDTYLGAAFALADVGRPRVEALRDRLAQTAPGVTVSAATEALADDAAADAAVAGSDFVVSCVDAADVATNYRLNRVCAARGIPWLPAVARGFEVLVGPTVEPGGACFLCATMRGVACERDPFRAFTQQSYFDRRERDDSDRRENVVFGIGLAANLTGLEIFNRACGLQAATRGAVLVFDLVKLQLDRYTVLRKPDCPVCFPRAAPERAAQPAASGAPR